MKLILIKEIDSSKYTSFNTLQTGKLYYTDEHIYTDMRKRTIRLLDNDNNGYYIQLIEVLHNFKPIILLPYKDGYKEFAIPLCILYSLKKVIKIDVDLYEYRSFDNNVDTVKREIGSLAKWAKRFGSELEDVSLQSTDNALTIQFILKEPLASILIKNNLVKVQERTNYRRNPQLKCWPTINGKKKDIINLFEAV